MESFGSSIKELRWSLLVVLTWKLTTPYLTEKLLYSGGMEVDVMTGVSRDGKRHVQTVVDERGVRLLSGCSISWQHSMF